MSKTLLMDEAALKSRCNKARYDILRRARPRLWKSGKRAGTVRTPGITELSFTSAELWQRALDQVGPGAIQCPYCVAIGRPANIITLANYVWDHRVPVAQGGSHDLENLFAICSECNGDKGSMTYELFVAMLSAIWLWPNPRDRAYVLSCLRTHGKVMKSFGRGKPKPNTTPDVVTSGVLALEEDF